MTSPPVARRESEPSVVARFPSERQSDAKLLEALALGEPAALAAIWDRYAELVEGVIYRALGPDGAKDDLVQEVFLALWRGARSVREGAALRGYLIGVTVRQAALELRRRKVRRWVRLAPTGELPEIAAPARELEGIETLRALYRIFDQMPERRRLAFVLRHVQELDVPATAEALGVSESTVKRELIKGWQQIRSFSKREPSLAEFLSRMEQREQQS